MTDTVQVYDLLAQLLKYPGDGYSQDVAHCRDALALVHSEGAALIDKFAEQIRSLSTEQCQELFVQTFDLNPVCALEAGWHLFGDTYERGAFLVKMRQTLRRHGVAESREMPDHLTHVLALLGRMGREEADEFVANSVLPALEKMLAGMEGKASPYENVLKAIRAALAADHAGVLHEVKHE